MGTEMKTPESGEGSLRNRKRKENVSVKSSMKSEKLVEEDKMEVEQPKVDELKVPRVVADAPTTTATDTSFRIRLEFDPMSIVLLSLALVTRFFRLSEPNNVV